jgi:AcrR family transcriptional regulator
VPTRWDETVDGHRRAVQDAVLDAAWSLVEERGLLAVTMSDIAERAGIGRATLYRHFADVPAVLQQWHARQVAEHLAELSEVAGTGPAEGRLEAVLLTWARIARQRGRRDVDLVAALHPEPDGAHREPAHHRLQALVAGLVAEGAAGGHVRGDVPADELAAWCLGALTAAAQSSSDAAVRRLVSVTVDGLRPPG